MAMLVITRWYTHDFPTDPTGARHISHPEVPAFHRGGQEERGLHFSGASNGENMEKRREMRNPMDFMGYDTTDFMGIGIE